MSIEVMSWIWKNSKEDGPRLLILLALADHANQDGQCWPGIKSLAHKARTSERSCQTMLRALEDSGAIKIENQAGPHGCNLYTIALPSEEAQKPAPVQIPAGVQENVAGGAETCTGGVQKPAPEPSLNHQEPNAYASEEQPKRKRKDKAGPDKTGDERSKSPAIQCARGVAGRYPDKAIYDDVIKALGEHPDGERLAECRKAWIACGHNKNSWAWLLGWYTDGIPEYARKTINAKQPNPPRRAPIVKRVRIIDPFTNEIREVEGHL